MLSRNTPEDELLLPPNTRMLVQSLKPAGNDQDGFGGGYDYIVEVLILPII